MCSVQVLRKRPSVHQVTVGQLPARRKLAARSPRPLVPTTWFRRRTARPNSINSRTKSPNQQRSPPLVSTPGITFEKESGAKELPNKNISRSIKEFEEIIGEPIVISDEPSSDESETSSSGNFRQTSEILKILVDKNSIWTSPSVTKISNARLKAAIEDTKKDDNVDDLVYEDVEDDKNNNVS
ncbi:Hypothetical protein CINCED_3A000393 [Cinara cedri]|uniref:Uncharacterized protein n=1 Tax=Cinara cedri TaxID=506608 RepID=A0A5E4MMT4_9HEMI|nr:Hypothetical protein CINCED_3A000393 [Cinara cedri]